MGPNPSPRNVIKKLLVGAIVFAAVISAQVSNNGSGQSTFDLADLQLSIFVPTAAASEEEGSSCQACVCEGEEQVCCFAFCSGADIAICEAISETEVQCWCGMDSATASCG